MSEGVTDMADSSDTPLLLRTISSDNETNATPPSLRKLQTQVSFVAFDNIYYLWLSGDTLFKLYLCLIRIS